MILNLRPIYPVQKVSLLLISSFDDYCIRSFIHKMYIPFFHCHRKQIRIDRIHAKSQSKLKPKTNKVV